MKCKVFKGHACKGILLKSLFLEKNYKGKQTFLTVTFKTFLYRNLYLNVIYFGVFKTKYSNYNSLFQLTFAMNMWPNHYFFSSNFTISLVYFKKKAV